MPEAGSSRSQFVVPAPTSPVQASPAATAPVAPQPVAPAPATQRPIEPPATPFQPPTSNLHPKNATPVAPRRRLPPLSMDLPGVESAVHGAIVHTNKWRGIRRWAFRTTAVALVLVITLGGLLFSQSYLKLHKVFKGTTGTAEALKPVVKPELLKGEGSGRVNILLLGRGGGTHDAPDLTDTMMVASIDPVNHTSTLLSIPRDLWVEVPGGGAMKINGAWETGEFQYLHKVAPGSTDPKAIQAGFNTVDQTVKTVLGIDINYNVLVDFQAFKQAIDTVGGITVNVPSDLVDPTMAWENGHNPVLAKAGLQSFDGTHALTYVRSRETTSDFARSQRQRAVMLALKGKVETLGTLSNPMKISGLLSAFGDNVSTDLSLSNASRLYTILKGISDANTVSVGLGDEGNQLVTTTMLKGQSTVQPKAGQFNYGDIQSYVRSKLQDPYIKKEHAKILILNGTPTPGLASTMSTTLKSYGYNVIGASNTPNAGWTKTTLIDLTHKNQYTKHYLEQRFSQTAGTTLSDQTIATNGADFVIIIGSDEATPSQN